MLCQLLFAAIIAFGPTIDQANRVAGLASVAASIVVSVAAAAISTGRELKLGILAVITTVLAIFALPYSDGQVPRSPVAAIGVGFMGAGGAETRLLSPHIVGLAIGVPALFLISLVFHSGHPLWLRVLWFLTAAAGGVVVGLSDSRDALIAAATGLLVLMLSFVFKRRGFMLMVCTLAIAAAGLAALLFFGDDPALRGRAEVWNRALRALADTPVFGLGYGGLSGLYRREIPAVGTNAHNLFIQSAADFGLVGLSGLLLLVACSVRAAVVDACVSPALFRGFVASVAFVGVAGMAESIVDMTQRFPKADVTIVVPLLFVVLARPLIPLGVAGQRGQRGEPSARTRRAYAPRRSRDPGRSTRSADLEEPAVTR